MLLKNKNAVIYGGGGAIGGAVAAAFAQEGANVFLAGRTAHTLEATAKKIRSAGGVADIMTLDALDEDAVDKHLYQVVQKAGHIDISFNAIALNDVQGKALTKMRSDHFMRPVITAMNSYFITATAAARYMMAQGSGVILAITANAARKPYENTGGFGVSCAAIESFCRQLAFETGKYGIRVVCIQSAGSPDSPGVAEVFNKHAANAGITREAFDRAFAERTMLKRLPRLAEIAGTAVLMASDKASTITAAVINATCGELAD